ncbi:unnamed protein product, partial [Polarella glacialis]
MERIDPRTQRSGITTLRPSRYPHRHKMIEDGDQFIILLKWHPDSLECWDRTVTIARSNLPRAQVVRNDFRHMEQFAATCKIARTNYLLFMGNWTKKSLRSYGAPAVRNDHFIMPPEGPTRWRAFIAETRWNDRLKREVFVGWWTVSQLTPAKSKGEQEKFFRAFQQERDIGQGFIRRHQVPGRFRNNRWNGWLYRRRTFLEKAEEVVE